ncbi:MAG: hypothetical protein ABI705_10745 [Aestuariivirga sp.]
MKADSPFPFDTEPSPVGEQCLIPGVAPVSMKARLEVLAAHPLASAKMQKPCNIGLFDEVARNQLDLFSTPPTIKDETSWTS